MNSAEKPRQKRTHSKFDEREDCLLRLIVSQLGTDNWKAVAEKMVCRTARQCRDRWKHYINPQTNNSEWTIEEEQRLMQAFQAVGRHWGLLASMFPGRTSIGVRNHVWKLLRMQNNSMNTEISSDSNDSGSEAPDESRLHPEISHDRQRVLLPSIINFPFPDIPNFV